MSAGTGQWIRRSPSSNNKGPLKATLPMSSLTRQNSNLKQQQQTISSGNYGDSISISPSTSIWKCTVSPETSCGLRSPGAINYKGENKNVRSQSAQEYSCISMRRTASLDTVYLTGHWPRESMYLSNLQVDRSTQTEDWIGDQSRKNCVRSHQDVLSCTNEDKLDKFIRHRMQRTKEAAATTAVVATNRDRNVAIAGLSLLSSGSGSTNNILSGLCTSSGSNIIGSGLLLSDNLSSSSSSGCNQDNTLLMNELQQNQQSGCSSTSSSCSSTGPGGGGGGGGVGSGSGSGGHIVTTKGGSIEGLNQEIERLVLRSSVGGRHLDRQHIKGCCESTPEGHRAPVADLLRQTRSVNTQTPAYTSNSSTHSSGPPSRDSGSPAGSATTNRSDSRPSSDLQGVSEDSSPETEGRQLGTSPRINRFLEREPPDGCERVSLRFTDENRKPMVDISEMDYPLKPSVNFQLKPSLGSAFQPLKSTQ